MKLNVPIEVYLIKICVERFQMGSETESRESEFRWVVA